jgi:hypothetical protein
MFSITGGATYGQRIPIVHDTHQLTPKETHTKSDFIPSLLQRKSRLDIILTAILRANTADVEHDFLLGDPVNQVRSR